MSMRQTIAVISQMEADGVQRTEAMKTNAKTYPDISDILERKAAGRVDLHARSFAEKLDALDALRDRAGPLRAAKAARSEREPVQDPAPDMRP